MSTTDQRTCDGAAPSAGRDGWAVPGVDHAGVDGAVREAPAAAEEAVAGWQADLRAAAGGGASGGSGAGDGGGGHVHPVIGALWVCLEALDGVREARVGTLTARELRVLLLAVVQVIAAAFALKLRLLVAAEAQRVWELTGATSTAAFVAHLTQSRHPDAAAEVRLAGDLEHRYRLLAAALARGALGPEQVRVCVAALRRLPRDLPADQVEACQRFLVDAAQTMNPRQLRVLGRKLWEVIDPDGAEAKEGKALQDEEDLARATAYLKYWRNGDGSTGFRGKLPDLQADMLIKAVKAYASPRRRKNPTIPTSQPDNTTRNDTAGDGTGNTADSAAGGSESPADTGRAPADGPGDALGDGPGGGSPGGRGPDPDALLADDLAESPEERDTGRTIPYPVRLGHGLIDLVERLPADAIPYAGGFAATIVATLRADQLRTGLGTATLDTGTQVTAAQLRRFACDTGLIPAVLDGTSQPLDLGREQRLHTRYQRIAMYLRDGGHCATTGCERPGTDAHHPHPWSHGGPTSLANGVMLCPYHHHLAHHPSWQLQHTNSTWTLKRVSR